MPMNFLLINVSFTTDPLRPSLQKNLHRCPFFVSTVCPCSSLHTGLHPCRILFTPWPASNAHAQNQLRRLKDKTALVRAMMEEPNSIGQFVGTVPSPFKKYPGVRHRISLHDTLESRVLFSEVQLFASAGAPTYVVILGTLNDDDSNDS